MIKIDKVKVGDRLYWIEPWDDEYSDVEGAFWTIVEVCETSKNEYVQAMGTDGSTYLFCKHDMRSLFRTKQAALNALQKNYEQTVQYMNEELQDRLDKIEKVFTEMLGKLSKSELDKTSV